MMRYLLVSLILVLLAGRGAAAAPPETETLRADVCVVGGGSGGYAAALAAARAGAHCILIEKSSQLGGTSTAAYVSNWEPGPGDSLAREIYDRLEEIPDAVGIVRDYNGDRAKGSFGLWLTTDGLDYEETLRRSRFPRDQWRAVVFEPAALDRVVRRMLAETGRCRVLLDTTFTEVVAAGRRIDAIGADRAEGPPLRIEAKVFIDSTGDAFLCRAAGYEAMLGPDPRSRFGEPFAPETPDNTLNAISLCYRITPKADPRPAEAPDPPVKSWPRSAHCSGLPCGDIIVNPLATIPGRDLIDHGYDACMARARRIVQAQWHWLQKNGTFASYEFHSFAPMLGIRESYRVVTEYVLRQQDLEAGLSGQNHPDIIAVADHSMDVHGAGSRRVHGELDEPYGIPYRCLIPKGAENLLVACRGAGFSHIAASSCRLSRTMIQLGHAAGLAAATAARDQVPVGRVDAGALRAALRPEERIR